MSATHRIRLQGHWQRTELPSGGVRWSRRFGQPANVALVGQMWLVVASLPGDSVVSVNGVLLSLVPEWGQLSANISEVMKPRNLVEIELREGVELGEVAIEFRR